jgi:hypothetical protein
MHDIEYLFVVCSGAPIKSIMIGTAMIEEGTAVFDEASAERSF